MVFNGNISPFMQIQDDTKVREKDRTSTGMAKKFPRWVGRRTLQICHIEATHCVLSTSIPHSLNKSCPGTIPQVVGWCGRTVRW
jgi:hypothetical protein